MVVVRFLERNTWLTLLQATQLLMGTCYLLGKVAGLSCWPLDPQDYLQTLFVDPDHLCFDRTTYDNIIGPARPLMYPDQISRYRSIIYVWFAARGLHNIKEAMTCLIAKAHNILFKVVIAPITEKSTE